MRNLIERVQNFCGNNKNVVGDKDSYKFIRPPLSVTIVWGFFLYTLTDERKDSEGDGGKYDWGSIIR